MDDPRTRVLRRSDLQRKLIVQHRVIAADPNAPKRDRDEAGERVDALNVTCAG